AEISIDEKRNRIMKASSITRAILSDRERKTPKTSTAARPRDDFDPFAITRWRVIAGGDPGHLPKMSTRRGKVGWFVYCRHCQKEFESRGWAYCPKCMDLPAEKRRDPAKATGPLCECGCGRRI